MKRACFIVVIAVVLGGTCLAQSARQIEVVAEVSVTNQTRAIQGRILYTPKVTGMFRVNFYVQCVKGDPNNGTGLNPDLSWVDEIGEDVFSFPTLIDVVPQPPNSSTFIIKALGGYPIKWTVAKLANDESIYEVYIALERIGPTVQ